MLFLRFWVQTIRTLLNLVKCFPNYGILFLITPNMCRKDKKGIHNPRKHIISLILYLPIDSSPWFSKKNKVFQIKTFSNLVFGDDFDFDRSRWLSYESLFVSGAIWNLPPWWRTRGKLSRSQSRSREHGSLLTQSAKLIRMSLLLRIHYSKNSRIKTF